MKNLAFEAACKLCGSQQKLAEALGVTAAAVNHVVMGRRSIPAAWCPVIEKLTQGKVVCEQLRPDVAWGVVRENGTRILSPNVKQRPNN